MGWGLDQDSLTEKQDQEKKLYDGLMEKAPMMMAARDKRAPNADLWDKVVASMKDDGMESGFSARHMEKVIFGDFIPWLPQLIGSCVASGGMRAMARKSLVESFLLNQPEEIWGTKFVGTNNVAPFAPYSYRAGRYKGGINGMSDGSFCGAHIEGALDYGILPCSATGLVSDAFPEPQNTRNYKQWGADNRMMDKFAKQGRAYKLLNSQKIESYADHKSALRDRFEPQMVCSGWAFRPVKKHPTWKTAEGEPVWIYGRDRRTAWYHNMTLDANVTVGGQEYTVVDNSWGDNAHRNGSWFVVEASTMQAWIRDAQIYTIGDIDLRDNSSPV
jgi:hypothetical protein